MLVTLPFRSNYFRKCQHFPTFIVRSNVINYLLVLSQQFCNCRLRDPDILKLFLFYESGISYFQALRKFQCINAIYISLKISHQKIYSFQDAS